MVKEMELNLGNLVNEIIEQEYLYHSAMVSARSSFGEDSEDYKFWRTKWSVFYTLAKKFDFVDKLQR